MRLIPTVLVMLLCCCGTSLGQTPAPAAEPAPEGAEWGHYIAALAATLCNTDPEPAMLLLRDVELASLYSSETARDAALISQTNGATILACRVYRGVPQTLAGDLAEDINAADVPASLKRRYTPADSVALRDANRIAAEWIDEVLRPQTDQPTAVVVLRRRDSVLPSLSESNWDSQILFLLISGRIDGTATVAQRIVYGNPVVGR